MPTYTFKKNDQYHNIFCSINDLKELTEQMESEGYERIITAPAIVSGVGSAAVRHTDNGWKDILKRIKSKSGKNNTIDV